MLCYALLCYAMRSDSFPCRAELLLSESITRFTMSRIIRCKPGFLLYRHGLFLLCPGLFLYRHGLFLHRHGLPALAWHCFHNRTQNVCVRFSDFFRSGTLQDAISILIFHVPLIFFLFYLFLFMSIAEVVRKEMENCLLLPLLCVIPLDTITSI